jgi:hypothetical protein
MAKKEMRDFALLEENVNEIGFFLPASRLASQPLRPPNGATKTSDSGAGHEEGAMYSLARRFR